MSHDSTPQRSQLKPEEIVVLSREIQAMIAAGVPLDMGMRNVSAGFENRLESAAIHIAERLEQGATISEACAEEKSIPPVFRAILVAGLSCGQSEAVLADVANLTEMQTSLRQSLKIGLIYPLIVIFLAVGLLGGVIATMMPRIASLYEQLHIEFPYWLVLANGLHLTVIHFATLGILFLVTMSLLWRSGRLSPLSGLKWIPGVGNVINDFSIAHFSHLLSLLVTYEVPLPHALRLTGESISPGNLRTQTLQLADSISNGEEIDLAVERQTAFPKFLKWLLLIGHRDSDLGNALAQASNFYQDRARARAIWLSQVVPSTAVIAVGGTVTLLYALTVFGPLVNLWSKLAQY